MCPYQTYHDIIESYEEKFQVTDQQRIETLDKLQHSIYTVGSNPETQEPILIRYLYDFGFLIQSLKVNALSFRAALHTANIVIRTIERENSHLPHKDKYLSALMLGTNDAESNIKRRSLFDLGKQLNTCVICDKPIPLHKQISL